MKCCWSKKSVEGLQTLTHCYFWSSIIKGLKILKGPSSVQSGQMSNPFVFKSVAAAVTYILDAEIVELVKLIGIIKKQFHLFLFCTHHMNIFHYSLKW